MLLELGGSFLRLQSGSGRAYRDLNGAEIPIEAIIPSISRYREGRPEVEKERKNTSRQIYNTVILMFPGGKHLGESIP